MQEALPVWGLLALVWVFSSSARNKASPFLARRSGLKEEFGGEESLEFPKGERDVKTTEWMLGSSTTDAYLRRGRNWIRPQRAASQSLALWVWACQGKRFSDSFRPWGPGCDPEPEPQECRISHLTHDSGQEQRTQATPSCKQSPQ